MKFLAVLFAGLLTGAVVALGVVYYNPFSAKSSLSPLSVSERQQFTLTYSAVATDSILFTNDGESRVHPHPVKVLQLWEAPIRLTDTLVTVLRDSRNEPVGLGIKFSSQSERTRLLNGEALVDSAWYIYLPGQGFDVDRAVRELLAVPARYRDSRALEFGRQLARQLARHDDERAGRRSARPTSMAAAGRSRVSKPRQSKH